MRRILILSIVSILLLAVLTACIGNGGRNAQQKAAATAAATSAATTAATVASTVAATTAPAVTQTATIACTYGNVSVQVSVSDCAALMSAAAQLASSGGAAPVATQAPQPTTAPAATAAPTQAPTATAAASTDGSLPTFDYVPGGESYGQVANDVTNPAGQSNCLRVWQATNKVNLPWTFLLCNYQQSNPAPKQQWPHPTQFTVSGTGTVSFDLYRDQGAVAQLKQRGEYNGQDPYDVANAQKSQLGLAWEVQGFNATACIDGKCQDLNGGGVFQLGFPKDWTGHHHVVLTVNNGQLQFLQGEKVTSTDTWPAN